KISKDRRPEPSRVGPEELVAPRSRQRSEFNLQRTTETPRWSDTPTIKWQTSLREAGALIREPSTAGQGESCLDSRLPKAGMVQLGVVIYGARLHLE
ncbi:hypothetical protein Taro_034299, partial [Colocasia esculenta]|nr:hypothetical protein [Colocasia esculenta]